MGKFNPMIVLYSDSENSSDSLQLINPVTHLSLEHLEKNHSIKDFDDQSNQLAKLHLNESNSLIEKSIRKTNENRHHPYAKPSFKKNRPKPHKEINKKDQCNMNFLKSLGYLQYSSKKNKNPRPKMGKIDELFQSIKSTFSKYLNEKVESDEMKYICNRRAN